MRDRICVMQYQIYPVKSLHLLLFAGFGRKVSFDPKGHNGGCFSVWSVEDCRQEASSTDNQRVCLHSRFSSNKDKEVVHYQTILPKSLAKSVLDEGGSSNLVLQSSDISKDKQIDPALVDTLKLSFTGSDFSMAFPYVAMTDEKLESSLLSGFVENCNSGFQGNHITYTDTCTVSSEDLKKHSSMHSIHDVVRSRLGNNPSGQIDLIVFCSGGFKGLDNAKSEGELLSELVSVLKEFGAKHTIIYASQPYGFLQKPSGLPLGRFLAEKTNTTAKAGLGQCDGECRVKSSLLEGAFVGIVLLIILISGLCCMMGIDTPSRF